MSEHTTHVHFRADASRFRHAVDEVTEQMHRWVIRRRPVVGRLRYWRWRLRRWWEGRR